MSSPFVTALRTSRRRVITEVKRRDAQGNDLLGARPVAKVVAEFESAGAPCVSVVTGRWFGGDVDLLREVAAATDLPLLQKDFITRREQIQTARELGASAVLLTAELLPRAGMRTLVSTCLSAGMTPFVEVTDTEQIAAVPHPDECVIAVNNKDIAAKERTGAGVERSVSLLPALRRSGTECPVSASGIDSPEVAARLLDLGFAGLLVGTSILGTGSVASWLDKVDALRVHSGPSGAGGVDEQVHGSG